jgi:hypothetical protein
MFIKLFTQILDSSIADNRPLRHFFTDLMLCADCRGYVIMTESAIARRIGCTVEEVEWGIAELMKPDPRSKTPDADGARIERLDGQGYGWRVLNYESYRAMRDADQMREATKKRVRKFREKTDSLSNVTLCNAGVTHGNAITEAEAEAEAEGDGGEKSTAAPLDFEKSTPEKANPKRMATFPQVMAFAKSQPMPISEECCEAFFDRMEAEGWITPNGFPLADWQPRFRSWITNWANNANRVRAK